MISIRFIRWLEHSFEFLNLMLICARSSAAAAARGASSCSAGAGSARTSPPAKKRLHVNRDDRRRRCHPCPRIDDANPSPHPETHHACSKPLRHPFATKTRTMRRVDLQIERHTQTSRHCPREVNRAVGNSNQYQFACRILHNQISRLTRLLASFSSCYRYLSQGHPSALRRAPSRRPTPRAVASHVSIRFLPEWYLVLVYRYCIGARAVPLLALLSDPVSACVSEEETRLDSDPTSTRLDT